MDISGNLFKSIDDGNERKIYMYLYAVIAAGIVAVLVSAAAGHLMAFNGFMTSNNYNSIKVMNEVIENAAQLSAMDNRLKSIQTRFNEVKYQNRNSIRASINKDLSDIDFVVQTFTLKDFVPPEEIMTGAKPTIQSDQGAAPEETLAPAPAMVEVDITGRVSTENLIKVFNLIDHPDKLWYVTTLEIVPSESSGEFFSKSYLDLPVKEKKEMFKMYKEAIDEPMLNISMSFCTYVKSGEASAPAPATVSKALTETETVGN